MGCAGGSTAVETFIRLPLHDHDPLVGKEPRKNGRDLFKVHLLVIFFKSVDLFQFLLPQPGCSRTNRQNGQKGSRMEVGHCLIEWLQKKEEKTQTAEMS